ncbi:MAG: hypothetical protein WD024_06840 [Bacillota bacterium]
MVPTEELRTKLRRLLAESIPAGGTDGDTRFSNADIDDLLTGADNVYLAASEGWTEKAGQLQDGLGPLAETQAGDERHTKVNLTTAVNYCFDMAKVYGAKGKSAAGYGTRLMGLEAPAAKAGDPQ